MSPSLSVSTNAFRPFQFSGLPFRPTVFTNEAASLHLTLLVPGQGELHPWPAKDACLPKCRPSDLCPPLLLRQRCSARWRLQRISDAQWRQTKNQGAWVCPLTIILLLVIYGVDEPQYHRYLKTANRSTSLIRIHTHTRSGGEPSQPHHQLHQPH